MKPVSDAWFGAKVARSSRFGFEFPSNVREVYSEVIGLFGVLRTPHFMQQRTLGNQLSIGQYEAANNLPLEWGEVDNLKIPSDYARNKVDREVLCHDLVKGRF